MARRVCLWVSLLGLVGLLMAATANADVPIRKIVVFKESVAAAGKQAAVREVGGNPLKSVKLVNAASAELTPASAAALSARADVLRVTDDRIAQEHAAGTVAPDARGGTAGILAKSAGQTVPWGINRVRAPDAWGTSRGQGVKVAVLDSGIDLKHPDLHVAGGVNLVDGVKSYDDDRGHGTHVAGIIAALDNDRGVVGVGPGIQLYAVKVLDKKGRGWWSDIYAGLDWCVDNGMQVANMSFGSTTYDQTYEEVIYRTYQSGVVLVASAGNDGPTPNSVEYPARYNGVIAVSAVDAVGKLPSWSSSGPQIDLAAPGVDIYSTYKGPNYSTLSGTSMAAPHVAGVAALRVAIDSDRSPDHIADVLKRNATPLPGLSLDQQGAGLVDAYKVVNQR